MNLYQPNRLLEDLEDPFSSSLLKNIDSMPLTIQYLDKKTRVDLVTNGQDDENNLPAYIYLNRVSDSLFVSVFSKPASINDFDRLMSSASSNSIH